MNIEVGKLYRDTQTREVVLVVREQLERQKDKVVVILYLHDPEHENRWSESGFINNFVEHSE